MGGEDAVPPQNPIDRTIADVSPLGIELADPDASLPVRPACDPQIAHEAAARARAPHVASAGRRPPAMSPTPRAHTLVDEMRSWGTLLRIRY